MRERKTPKLNLTVESEPGSPREPGSAAHTNVNAPGSSTLRTSALGSGLLAQQPTPTADNPIAITKLCPQCGTEYETGDRFCPKDGSPLRPKSADDPLIGRVIADRYLMLARLGEGGMGRVYLAEHVKMTRQCAIKVMNPTLMHDSGAVARFAREASSTARILHPNVAAVFDFGEADKIVYLVMEYVDGESLSAMLAREGPLDARRSIELARQIADGLAAAHELGIVHRDLKPDNVIIARTRSGKEVAKVVDFGIAKAVTDAPQDALTRSGLVIGTPEYMSPEQLLGDPIDPRSDIYSFGCIVYQMLTGSQPFASETREQMIRRRLHEPPPHVRDVLPDLPRRLDTLIVHMLALSPGDRLASATEARDALDPSLTLGGWERSSLGTSSSGWAVPALSDPSLQPTAPMPRQQRPRSRWVAGIIVSAAALAGVLTLTPRLEEKPVTKPAPAAPVPAPIASLIVADTTPAKPVESPAAASVTPAVKKPARTKPKVDSTALLAGKTAAAAEAAALTEEEALKSPLERFRAASERRDLVALADAVPSISELQRKPFEQIYQTGDNIHATSKIGEPIVSGDRAEVPFSLRMTYLDKLSKTSNSVQLNYQAVLARRGTKWEIAELRMP